MYISALCQMPSETKWQLLSSTYIWTSSEKIIKFTSIFIWELITLCSCERLVSPGNSHNSFYVGCVPGIVSSVPRQPKSAIRCITISIISSIQVWEKAGYEPPASWNIPFTAMLCYDIFVETLFHTNEKNNVYLFKVVQGQAIVHISMITSCIKDVFVHIIYD